MSDVRLFVRIVKCAWYSLISKLILKKGIFKCWRVNWDSAKLIFPANLWQDCWPVNSRSVFVLKPILYYVHSCVYCVSPHLFQNPKPKKSVLQSSVLKLSICFFCLLESLARLQMITMTFPFILVNGGFSGQYL